MGHGVQQAVDLPLAWSCKSVADFDTAKRRPQRPSSHVDARLADLDPLSDEERATITNVIDAHVTKAKLRPSTGGAS